MGKTYHEVLDEMGIDVEFICDIKKEIKHEKVFESYKDALDSKSIEGVIVTTYGPSHYEIVKYAIAKKIKYIVCEKPFTTSVTNAVDITERLKKCDTRLTIGYLRRFSDIYSSLLKKLYEEKIIGNIQTVTITSGAGGISTLGTHFIDLSTLLLSEKIKSVFAISINKNHPNPRGEDFEDPGGYFMLNFENEKRAFIDMGDDLGLQPKIEIIGTFGRIEINEINKKIIGYARNKQDQEKPMKFYGLENRIIINETFDLESINLLIKNMIKNLISKDDLKMTAEVAKEKVEVYSAIRKSFDTGENVFLPLKDAYYDKEFMVT